jgi:hypothetical protein
MDDCLAMNENTVATNKIDLSSLQANLANGLGTSSIAQALQLGLSRTQFARAPQIAALISEQGPAAALRCLVSERLLREAAGQLPSIEAGVAAPAEQTPLPRVAGQLQLQLIVAEDIWLLTEAMQLLAARQLRLPHAALAALLVRAENQSELRPHIAKVAGERGAWLAKTLQAYTWLLNIDATGDATSWQQSLEEDLLPARIASLRAWRLADPHAARNALAVVFAQEKADVRLALLQVLETGLSTDDESWLASLRTDRAATVQQYARDLQLRLPDSALGQRCIEILRAVLSVNSGDIELKLPTEWPSTAIADGFVTAPKDHANPKLFAAGVLAKLTHPADWMAITGSDAHTLCTSLLDTAYFDVIFEAWSSRGLLAPLAQALVQCLLTQQQMGKHKKLSYELRWQRKQLLSDAVGLFSEAQTLALWASNDLDRDVFTASVERLQRPWSAAISQAWIALLQRKTALAVQIAMTTPAPIAVVADAATNAGSANSGTANSRYSDEPFWNQLHQAAIGLDANQITSLMALQLPDDHPRVREFQSFQSMLAKRARLYQELQA